MLINRVRSCWWLRLAFRLAAFCLVISASSSALSQEEPPSGAIAGVETVGSPEETPVEPAGTVASEEATAALSPDETAAEPTVATPPPEETAEKPPKPPEIAPLKPTDLQPVFPLTGQPEGQPFGGDWFNERESVWKMSVALLIVLALICVSVFVLKRMVGGGPVFLDQRLGRVIGRIHLSPKAVLYLVRVGGKVLVVGTAPGAISLVAEISDPDVVAQMEGTRAGELAGVKAPFADRVSRFFSKSSETEATGDEEARFEEYLRDIKGQMERLSALIGGSEDEEEL